MSEFGAIEASVRKAAGKGAARQIRRKGKIPAVLYGGGKDNVALTIDPHEFDKATDPAKPVNTLYTVTIKQDGQPDATELCVIADHQRDAIKDKYVHLDLLRIDPDKEIVRRVPVSYSGRAAGVVVGGKLITYLRDVQISAKPSEIPEVIKVDVTPLESGATMRLSEVPLANGSYVAKPETPVAYIEPPKAKTAEDEEGGAGGEELKKE